MSYVEIRRAVAAHLETERYPEILPTVALAFTIAVLKAGR